MLISSNAIFGTTVFFILICLIYISLTLNRLYDNKSEKYKKLSYLIITYSIAASIILYGFALYFFAAFPKSGSVFLILTAILLFGIQSLSVFITQWRVANIREKISGGSNNQNNNSNLHNFPSLIGSIISTVSVIALSFVLFLRNVYYKPEEILTNSLIFSTIPVLVAFSIFSTSQSLVNLKNITGLFA